MAQGFHKHHREHVLNALGDKHKLSDTDPEGHPRSPEVVEATRRIKAWGDSTFELRDRFIVRTFNPEQSYGLLAQVRTVKNDDIFTIRMYTYKDEYHRFSCYCSKYGYSGKDDMPLNRIMVHIEKAIALHRQGVSEGILEPW